MIAPTISDKPFELLLDFETQCEHCGDPNCRKYSTETLCRSCAMEYLDRREVEKAWFEEQFSEDVRNYAASSLVAALLSSCESQEERIELSINLLGYDPRD